LEGAAPGAGYPYLYLEASYFKVNWGGRVVDLALLVAVGVNEESLVNLATVVMLRVTEDWAFRRYMDMAQLSRRGRETHKNRDLTQDRNGNV